MKLFLKLIVLSSILCCTACRKDVLRVKQLQIISIASTQQLNNALFTPNQLGILVAGDRFEHGQYWISKDLGTTWELQSLPNEVKGLFGLCVYEHKLYSTAMDMRVVKMQDTQVTNVQTKMLLNKAEFLSAISFAQAQQGVAVSALGTDSGALVVLDSALNLLRFTRYKAQLRDVKMISPQIGIAVGSGMVLKTTDSAQSWQKLAALGDNFMSLDALDAQNWVIAGLSGSILQSNDAGQHWQKLRNGSNPTLPHYALWDIYYKNTLEIYAVGEKGLLIYSDDGGKHWMEYERLCKQNLRFICPCPDGSLLIGGEGAQLFKIKP